MRILSTPEIRREHIKLCKGVNTGAQQINMPDEGTNLSFQDGYKQLKAPFVIYADFECFNIMSDEKCLLAKDNNPCGNKDCFICDAYVG